MSAKKKLLIVDDNTTNRKILCKILWDQYELLEAENGKIALEILESEKESISAVLLDLIMPVMDGYAVMEAMRKDALLSQIPIIVTTGNNDNETEDKALSLGANDFILKPYKPSIIRLRLANTINLRETAALMNTVQKDALTGLLKKEFFYQQIEAIIKGNPDKKYDILCSDIARFRLVNDLFGIHVGDALLKYTADLIKETIPSVLICGRIGVDQFACLLPHNDLYENSFFDDTLKGIARFPATIGLQVKFGIYHIHDRLVPVNVMCDRAVIACASIKGKYDAIFSYYNDEIREKLLAEQSILDNMKRGILEKQFQVYYQPKYEIATEKSPAQKR